MCLGRSPTFQVDTEEKPHIVSLLQCLPLLCTRNYLKMANASCMIFAAARLQCVLALTEGGGGSPEMNCQDIGCSSQQL